MRFYFDANFFPYRVSDESHTACEVSLPPGVLLPIALLLITNSTNTNH